MTSEGSNAGQNMVLFEIKTLIISPHCLDLQLRYERNIPHIHN